MTANERVRIRLQVARGHWLLEEREEAVACLERVAEPGVRGLEVVVLAEQLREASPPDSAIAARLGELVRRFEPASPLQPPSAPLPQPQSELQPQLEPLPSPARVSPLASPTLAVLLAEQGQAREARAVTEQLLQRDPSDPRALALREQISAAGTRRRAAIARLERWLGAIRRNAQGDAWA
jgi:hypothetical protein